jgi:glyceraldehyde 3-phosphate dehydrogenase
MVKIGLNGFGRIGKSIARICLDHDDIKIAAINEVNPDIKNIAYQLKYDSIYGRLEKDISVNGEKLIVDKKQICIFHSERIEDVPWSDIGAEIVIDASGVFQNAASAATLIAQGIKKVVVTHCPEVTPTSTGKIVDFTLALGANESDYDPRTQHVISSGICDSTALAPVLKIINEHFGLIQGSLTSVHPCLSYQNLLDGGCHSWSFPGKTYSHYPLGRAANLSLIPKPTTAMDATALVLPGIDKNFLCFSYRVPTTVVTTADLSLQIEKHTTVQEIKDVFHEYEQQQRYKIIHNNYEPLVSIDFCGLEYSAIVDQQWTMLTDKQLLKLVLWYDNEFGYSTRVVDIVQFLASFY